MRHRRLIDSITHLKANDTSVGTDGGQIRVFAGSSRYPELLQEFPDIIRPSGIPGNPGTLQSITSAPRLGHL
jgi:hypothetical protein